MRCLPSFILDTNVVSELGRPAPDRRVVAWIDGAPAGSLAIPWSTVFELQLGVELARRAGSKRAGDYEEALLTLLADKRFRILRPSTEAARIRARMHATPALRNFFSTRPAARNIRTGEDLTIAATAIAAGLPIATLNIRDFVTIDCHFELPGMLDPARGEWVIPERPGPRTARRFRQNPPTVSARRNDRRRTEGLSSDTAVTDVVRIA